MMSEEFIPYEEARLLKGLGFNEPCLRYYWEGATELMGNNTSPKTNWELTDLSNSDLKELQGTIFMSAPLYQQAFRWFREKYNLLGIVNIDLSDNLKDEVYVYSIEDHLGSIVDRSEEFKTYEEAELACLKKLIEIIKSKQR